MKHINKPLIIGISHHNTYGLVRCFGEAGLGVDLILYGCKDSYIGRSKYVDALWYCDTEEDALKQLCYIVSTDDLKYVIVTATDSIASLMDLHYEDLKGKCRFFNCGGSGRLTHFMDKAVQSEIASSVGLNIPKTAHFKKGDKVRFDIFPCIIKPLASIEGGKHIIVCNDEEDLCRQAKDLVNTESVIVQQYIEKEEEIVLLGVACGKQVIIPGYIIKYREIKGGTTYSSTSSISDLDQSFVDRAKMLVKKMNYEGLFGIEFIRRGDKYYFVEINLRNDATSYSLAVAGANLPVMYCNYCRDKRLPAGDELKVKRLNSIVEIVDLSNLLHRKVGLFKWLRQLKGSECKYYYSKSDKKPHRKALWEYVKHFV